VSDVLRNIWPSNLVFELDKFGGEIDVQPRKIGPGCSDTVMCIFIKHRGVRSDRIREITGAGTRDDLESKLPSAAQRNGNNPVLER